MVVELWLIRRGWVPRRASSRNKGSKAFVDDEKMFFVVRAESKREERNGERRGCPGRQGRVLEGPCRLLKRIGCVS